MIQVCCFGNSLHGDDGVGLAVYETLKPQDIHNQVHFFADVPINALSTLMSCQSAVLVDAINAPDQNGEILELSLDQLQNYETNVNSSAHLNSISYLIAALKHSVSALPEIKVYGVGINKIDQYKIGLTSGATEAVEQLSQLLVKELNFTTLVDRE